MSELDAHTVLVAGRNRIGRDGWVNHAAAFGPWCAGNALFPERLHRGACLAFLAAIPLSPGRNSVGAIVRWNNAPGRTKAEVLAAFDRAIAATSPAPSDPLEGVEMAEVVA